MTVKAHAGRAHPLRQRRGQLIGDRDVAADYGEEAAQPLRVGPVLLQMLVGIACHPLGLGRAAGELEGRWFAERQRQHRPGTKRGGQHGGYRSRRLAYQVRPVRQQPGDQRRVGIEILTEADLLAAGSSR